MYADLSAKREAAAQQAAIDAAPEVETVFEDAPEAVESADVVEEDTTTEE